MGKPKKRKGTFNYNKDRRREWTKSKKVPKIECKQIRAAWDDRKSMRENLREMGLSADANKTIRIPTAKELLGPNPPAEDLAAARQGISRGRKQHVVEALEAESKLPTERRLKLSEPDEAFCITMMERHGEDYKAMARDPDNHYQDTPKQIARKIRLFCSIRERTRKK